VIRLVAHLSATTPLDVLQMAETLRKAGVDVVKVDPLFGLVSGTAPPDVVDALLEIPGVVCVARDDHLWDEAAFRGRR